MIINGIIALEASVYNTVFDSGYVMTGAVYCCING
jgi:hypothetical protein